MGARILVIEDNQDNMELMRVLLTALGHTPVLAFSGAEGIKSANAEPPPDLVLLDLQMPGMDGFQTLEVLRSTPGTAEIPVIALTAFAMAADRERVLMADFDGHIAKPIAPEAFAGQIEPFLAAGRL
jgi:CheY-like chemotaxis protein